MSDNLNYILSLCQQISHKGQIPSVALIRGQSQRNLPIPQIISALKRWKEAPSTIGQEIETVAEKEPHQPLTLEQRVEQLEQQVRQLQHLLLNK